MSALFLCRKACLSSDDPASRMLVAVLSAVHQGVCQDPLEAAPSRQVDIYRVYRGSHLRVQWSTLGLLSSCADAVENFDHGGVHDVDRSTMF